jgi:uncharacterized membrane protein YcjF (UPF0283 family)
VTTTASAPDSTERAVLRRSRLNLIVFAAVGVVGGLWTIGMFITSVQAGFQDVSTEQLVMMGASAATSLLVLIVADEWRRVLARLQNEKDVQIRLRRPLPMMLQLIGVVLIGAWFLIRLTR